MPVRTRTTRNRSPRKHSLLLRPTVIGITLSFFFISHQHIHHSASAGMQVDRAQLFALEFSCGSPKAAIAPVRICRQAGIGTMASVCPSRLPEQFDAVPSHNAGQNRAELLAGTAVLPESPERGWSES